MTQHHPDRDLVRFYTERYDEDARLCTSPHGRLEFERTRELLLGRLPPPPARILDVGGGTGVHAEWLFGGRALGRRDRIRRRGASRTAATAPMRCCCSGRFITSSKPLIARRRSPRRGA